MGIKLLFPNCLYQSPIAAITNYTNVLSYSPGGQTSKMGWQGCVPSGGSRKHLPLCLSSFQSPPSLRGPWSLPPSSKYMTPTSASVTRSPFLTLTSLPPSLPYKDPCDYIGSTRITQDTLPISRSLT